MFELTIGMYQVEPPEGMTVEEFQQFMRSEVFPAVDTGQTRAGLVTGQRLYKANIDQEKYLWIVEYTREGGTGRPTEKSEAAAAILAARGARVTGLGDFDEIDTGREKE